MFIKISNKKIIFTFKGEWTGWYIALYFLLISEEDNKALNMTLTLQQSKIYSFEIFVKLLMKSSENPLRKSSESYHLKLGCYQLSTTSIQGNQSEVEYVTSSVFYLIEIHIWRGYILLKFTPESVPWFQWYEQPKDSQNNRRH